MSFFSLFMLSLCVSHVFAEETSIQQKFHSFFYKDDGSLNGIAVAGSLILPLLIILYFVTSKRVNGKLAPIVPYTIPYFGSSFQLGVNPVKFVMDQQKKYGDIFRARVMGRDFTFISGEEGTKFFYETPEEELCARKAYAFTIPVFGKGVVYDADPSVFLEHRKFASSGLTKKRFEKYTEYIQKIVDEYTEEAWGKSGEIDLLESLNTITLKTSTYCIQGEEVYSRFNDEFASLYNNLDRALGFVSFLYPGLPIPLHFNRDSSREKIKELYKEIIAHRKANPDEEHNDLIETLLNKTYSDNTTLTDEEIIGICTALLIAGQHTSNVTSTWTGVHVLQHEDVQKKVLQELTDVFGPLNQPYKLTYEKLQNCQYLMSCIKETLRIRPPIIMIMRVAEKEFNFKDYVIPKDSLCVIAPHVSHMSPNAYSSPESFRPERFSKDSGEAPKSKYQYLAFSAGRHACIGEQFAYLQIAAIWITLLRKYNLSLNNKKVEPDYTTMIIGPKAPVTVSYKPIE